MKPVVTLGETMGLFRAVTVGRLADVSDFQLGFGGAESNVAIGLTRLGIPARWVGRVGADGIGERIVRELTAEGVDVAAATDPRATTGLMVKEQGTTDARPVIYYRSGSAGSRLSPEDVEAAGIADAALLHVTGITPGLSESAQAAVRRAVEIARGAGVLVSFDLNHRPGVWGDRDCVPMYRELVGAADIVFGGDDEAALVLPGVESPVELAGGLAAMGPSEVVIKLGARGCFALIDGVEYEQAALPIVPVDTVGAGDAFVAGYLAERVGGLGAKERLKTATATGAYACLHVGDWEGLPTRAELARLE